jgi:AcrR family transcriptional regulator
VTAPARKACATDRILAVVASMLESEGTAAVQLPQVARAAQVSLRTVYQNFGSREGLILAAVEAWMESHVGTNQPGARPPAHQPEPEPMMKPRA